MLVTHVDDMMWAAKPEVEDSIQAIIAAFAMNASKLKTGEFRFCGKLVNRSPDFTIVVTCKDTTEQIGPVRFSVGNRKLTDFATHAEIGQMKRGRILRMDRTTVPTGHFIPCEQDAGSCIKGYSPRLEGYQLGVGAGVGA